MPATKMLQVSNFTILMIDFNTFSKATLPWLYTITRLAILPYLTARTRKELNDSVRSVRNVSMSVALQQ